MNNIQNYQEQQEGERLQNRISSFLEDFKVGTLLGGCGISKLRGAKPLAVFTAMFYQVFEQRCHDDPRTLGSLFWLLVIWCGFDILKDQIHTK